MKHSVITGGVPKFKETNRTFFPKSLPLQELLPEVHWKTVSETPQSLSLEAKNIRVSPRWAGLLRCCCVWVSYGGVLVEIKNSKGVSCEEPATISTTNSVSKSNIRASVCFRRNSYTSIKWLLALVLKLGGSVPLARDIDEVVRKSQILYKRSIASRYGQDLPHNDRLAIHCHCLFRSR